MTDTNGIIVIFAFVIALIIAYATTPLTIRLAFKINALDIPKDARRMHKKPTPRIGGIAIIYGFLISVFCFAAFVINGKPNWSLIGILSGSILIGVLGFLDDLNPKKAILKFGIQIIAASIPVLCGVRVIAITNPFTDMMIRIPEWISYGGSVLWIVGVTNAVNLIDGLDGLAAGVSSIASVALLSILLMQHNANATMMILTAALAGACFGFLPFNFNPAKTFMGDVGATFLGFILGCSSIQGPFKTYVSFIIPFLIIGLPIFDTSFAILRRVIKGQGIMTPDRGHMHHRLIDNGFSHKTTVIILYALSAVLAISAIVLFISDFLRALLIMVAMVILAAFMIVGKHTMSKHAEHHEETNKEKKE